jgi:hypothetical protein
VTTGAILVARRSSSRAVSSTAQPIAGDQPNREKEEPG